MIYCDPCRVKQDWPKNQSLRGVGTSECAVCLQKNVYCYNVPRPDLTLEDAAAYLNGENLPGVDSPEAREKYDAMLAQSVRLDRAEKAADVAESLVRDYLAREAEREAREAHEAQPTVWDRLRNDEGPI